MTTLNDLRAADRHRQHMALLTEIRDALTPKCITEEANPEPVDVTEEPPVGKQLTDRDDDVWERSERGWQVIGANGRPASPGRMPVEWAVVRHYAPLRPTTDADRERVGIAPSLHRLEDVAAEFGVDLDAPDVDPDEALNRAVAEAIDDVSPPPPAPWDADWLDRATAAAIRAAREHIEAEWKPYILREQSARETAQDDVERLARERDDLRDRVDDLIRERGQAIERYKALRQDAVGEHLHARDGSEAEASLAYVLNRDDERGQQ